MAQYDIKRHFSSWLRKQPLNIGAAMCFMAYKARVWAEKIQASDLKTQEIHEKKLEKLKAKEYLSFPGFCELVGISRRSVYHIMELGELIPGKAGKRTVIRRGDIDKFLFRMEDVIPAKEAAQVPEVGYQGLLEHSVNNRAIWHKRTI